MPRVKQPLPGFAQNVASHRLVQAPEKLDTTPFLLMSAVVACIAVPFVNVLVYVVRSWMMSLPLF